MRKSTNEKSTQETLVQGAAKSLCEFDPQRPATKYRRAAVHICYASHRTFWALKIGMHVHMHMQIPGQMFYGCMYKQQGPPRPLVRLLATLRQVVHVFVVFVVGAVAGTAGVRKNHRRAWFRVRRSWGWHMGPGLRSSVGGGYPAPTRTCGRWGSGRRRLLYGTTSAFRSRRSVDSCGLHPCCCGMSQGPWGVPCRAYCGSRRSSDTAGLAAGGTFDRGCRQTLTGPRCSARSRCGRRHDSCRWHR